MIRTSNPLSTALLIALIYLSAVKGGSIEVGKASTDAVVSCSALILFSDMILTQLLMQ